LRTHTEIERRYAWSSRAQIDGLGTNPSSNPSRRNSHLKRRGTSAAPFPIQLFLGRPPFLPHRESLLRCLRVVAFPPFLPMHRGQISLVMGCIEQYNSLRTTYCYPKRPLVKPPDGFFLPLPPCFPQSDSCSLCLSAVASPPPDAMHLGQINLVRE
jgi:hypothetical protein